MRYIINILFVFFMLHAKAQGIFDPIELPDVADGKMVPIKACSDCKGVVVIFTSLGCPYDQHYGERIKKLIEKYAGSISFFLINSSPGNEEQEDKMKAAYSSWGLAVPYLSDKKQKAMTALNAKRTPEAVLLKPEGGHLKIIYQGAIDDNPQVHHDTGNNFLDEALRALISGKSPKVASERVVGCTIRKGS